MTAASPSKRPVFDRTGGPSITESLRAAAWEVAGCPGGTKPPPSAAVAFGSWPLAELPVPPNDGTDG